MTFPDPNTFNFLTHGSGITTTKANHYANVASELVQAAERKLARIMPVSRKVILDNGETVDVNRVKFDKDDARKQLAVRPRLFTLSAWLRSAIKEKEIQMQKVDMLDYVHPKDDPQPIRPEMVRDVDKDWFLESLNIKERAEFLSVEASAAAVGNYIHNNGIVPEWQKECASEGLQNGVIGNKQVPVLVALDPKTSDDVDELFFELQKEHRMYESRVNYWMARMHDTLSEQNAKRHEARAELVRQWSAETQQWQARVDAGQKEFEAEKIRQKQLIAGMKVVIPQALQAVFDEVGQSAEISTNPNNDPESNE